MDHRELPTTSTSAAAAASVTSAAVGGSSVATIAAVAVTRVGSVAEEDEGHTWRAAAARPVAADAAGVAMAGPLALAKKDQRQKPKRLENDDHGQRDDDQPKELAVAVAKRVCLT